MPLPIEPLAHNVPVMALGFLQACPCRHLPAASSSLLSFSTFLRQTRAASCAGRRVWLYLYDDGRLDNIQLSFSNKVFLKIKSLKKIYIQIKVGEFPYTIQNAYGKKKFRRILGYIRAL